MTKRKMTEVEEKFFEMFEIKITYPDCENCEHYLLDNSIPNAKYECLFHLQEEFDVDDNYCANLTYPQVTSDLLLKIICILNKFELWGLPNSWEHAKEQVLRSCTEFIECSECACVKEEERDMFRRQIQEVFNAII